MKDRIKNGNFPKSIVTILISNLEYENLESNKEFKDFIEYLTNTEKTGKVFQINSLYKIDTFPAWISAFTGTRLTLNGIKGNILNAKIKILMS